MASIERKRFLPVTAGFKEDLTDFFQRFTAVENVRYEEFVKIWQDMKLPLICSGRICDRENREFLNECLRIVVSFILPPCSLPTQVGALYLLYGFYNVQICRPPVRIRITPQEWLELRKVYRRVKSECHYDAEFIYLKLLRQQAFDFVAVSMDINIRHRQEVDKYSGSAQSGNISADQFNIIDNAHIKTLAGVHSKYHKLKCQLAGDSSPHPDPSLNIIRGDFVGDITSIIENYKKGIIDMKFASELTNEQSIGDNTLNGTGATPSTTAVHYHAANSSTNMSEDSTAGTALEVLKQKAFRMPYEVQESRKGRSEDNSLQVTSRSAGKCYDVYAHDVKIADLEPPDGSMVGKATVDAVSILEKSEEITRHDKDAEGRTNPETVSGPMEKKTDCNKIRCKKVVPTESKTTGKSRSKRKSIEIDKNDNKQHFDSGLKRLKGKSRKDTIKSKSGSMDLRSKSTFDKSCKLSAKATSPITTLSHREQKLEPVQKTHTQHLLPMADTDRASTSSSRKPRKRIKKSTSAQCPITQK